MGGTDKISPEMVPAGANRFLFDPGSRALSVGSEIPDGIPACPGAGKTRAGNRSLCPFDRLGFGNQSLGGRNFSQYPVFTNEQRACTKHAAGTGILLQQRSSVSFVATSSKSGPEIRLEDVTFVFPEGTEPFLEHFNLTIHPAKNWPLWEITEPERPL